MGLQNGYLDNFLSSHGLQNNTQALVYFAVSKKGEEPIDGVTSVNPEGLTAVTGEWAHALKDRLSRANLTCKVVDSVSYRKAMFEKLIWISAYMMVGALNGGLTVGLVDYER